MTPNCGSSTAPLLATIASQLSSRSVLTLLASDSKAVQRVATEWLARLPEDDATQILWRGINSTETTCLGVLRALRHPDLELTEALRRRVLTLLGHDRQELRRATVAVITRRSPEDALAVLNEPLCRSDFEILRMLCWADEPKLVLPLLDAFGFPHRAPPPSIGFLVTAPWLADNYPTLPDAVEWLIRECGYCDQPVTGEVIELLSLGLSFVGPTMTVNGPADKWVERVRALSWQLVPDATDVTIRDRKPLDLSGPLDEALFLAAVRDTDRMRFALTRTAVPADLNRQQTESLPVCFHAPMRHVRRLFLTDAMTMADELSIDTSVRNQFVMDHARAVLESIPEEKIAADRALRTRWLGSRTGPGELPSRNRILGDLKPSPCDPMLSPGAQSVCWLSEAAGFDAEPLGKWLAECERRWSKFAVPIGIELQIPSADPNLFGSWKAAMEFLGIPSPNRPEFGGTIEAAFRPARSFHALLVAPLLLQRQQLICREQSQEMTLHISLQGDLGTDVLTLAFPQLFIHPSQRRNRPDSAMTRVLSKGLVYRNRDAELLGPRSAGESEVVRTEMRMFRVFANVVDQRLVISPTYVDDIVATHLIGSAMLSKCIDCRAIVDEYAQQIALKVAQLPSAFLRLLNSNFYESTGDPRDEVLLQTLPIFRAWCDVRKVIREQSLHDRLETLFESLRTAHVQQFSNHLLMDHRLDLATDLTAFADWRERIQA